MTRDELKERLAQETAAGEWRYLCELYDVLTYLRSEGVAAPALERFYATQETAMHKAQAGNGALDPVDIMVRGGAAGGVEWLVAQGVDEPEARSVIADARQTARHDIVKWHRGYKASPDISDQAYRLNVRFAADRMMAALDEMWAVEVQRLHNQPDDVRLERLKEMIRRVFEPGGSK